MLWLIWEMWIVLALFFVGGVIAGWIVRGRSDVADAPVAKQLGFATRMDAQRQAEPAPQPAPEPMASPEPAPAGDTGAQPDPGRETAAAPAVGAGDELTAIKGLGPKAAEKLQEMGVTRYAQIAAWSDSDVARFDRELNARGRIVRDDWVAQAKALAE
jgi:predicted flap endonuclease-1-like 5' DNA nuclease